MVRDMMSVTINH